MNDVNQCRRYKHIQKKELGFYAQGGASTSCTTNVLLSPAGRYANNHTGINLPEDTTVRRYGYDAKDAQCHRSELPTTTTGLTYKLQRRVDYDTGN